MKKWFSAPNWDTKNKVPQVFQMGHQWGTKSDPQTFFGNFGYYSVNVYISILIILFNVIIHVYYKHGEIGAQDL